MGVNKVILIGHLGRKPEIRYTSSGIPVASFTLATTERWGMDESGQRKEHIEWHRITAWRKLAEICGQYLDKGTKIYVEGRIRRSEYTGQDGIKRYSTDIHIDQMEILTPRGVRESVPSDEEFPNSFGGGQRPRTAETVPAAPNDVDLDPDIDLEEDEDFVMD